MIYLDPTRTLPLPATKPRPQPTNEDVLNHLIRMETRLVKLMYHVGLDANGRAREEN